MTAAHRGTEMDASAEGHGQKHRQQEWSVHRSKTADRRRRRYRGRGAISGIELLGRPSSTHLHEIVMCADLSTKASHMPSIFASHSQVLREAGHLPRGEVVENFNISVCAYFYGARENHVEIIFSI